jgi:hypothetical protein
VLSFYSYFSHNCRMVAPHCSLLPRWAKCLLWRNSSKVARMSTLGITNKSRA